jgi:hypothetical protein
MGESGNFDPNEVFPSVKLCKTGVEAFFQELQALKSSLLKRYTDRES